MQLIQNTHRERFDSWRWSLETGFVHPFTSTESWHVQVSFSSSSKSCWKGVSMILSRIALPTWTPKQMKHHAMKIHQESRKFCADRCFPKKNLHKLGRKKHNDHQPQRLNQRILPCFYLFWAWQMWSVCNVGRPWDSTIHQQIHLHELVHILIDGLVRQLVVDERVDATFLKRTNERITVLPTKQACLLGRTGTCRNWSWRVFQILDLFCKSHSIFKFWNWICKSTWCLSDYFSTGFITFITPCDTCWLVGWSWPLSRKSL